MGSRGKRLHGQCDGTAGIVQTHQKQRGDHCPCRAGQVVCIGRWVPAITCTRTWQTWWTLYKWRGTCWIDCKPAGTLYPCGWGNQLQSTARGHWEHLQEAWAVQGERLCAYGGHSWLYLHLSLATILPLLPGPSSCWYPDVHYADQQGCNWVTLGECRLLSPWWVDQIQWAAHPWHPRNVWQCWGLVACSLTNLKGWGDRWLYQLGHILQSLKWALESCTCWTIWAMGIGSELEWEGKQPKQLARTMSLPGLYLIV